MRLPTYSKVVDLLDILYAYTGGMYKGFFACRYDEPVEDVWSFLITCNIHPSVIWSSMVQTWVNHGVHGIHVITARNDKGGNLSLDLLINSPEEFVVRCGLRGISVPNIQYSCKLGEGPAFEAVKEKHRKWLLSTLACSVESAVEEVRAHSESGMIKSGNAGILLR